MTSLMRLWCFGPKSVFKALLEEGNHLFEKQEYTLAIAKYQECLTLLDYDNPERQQLISAEKIDKYIVPCLFGSAQACMELKQYHRSLNYCKAVIALRPKHSKAIRLQGLCCVQVGDFNGALKTIKTT